jgi:hypothetical protein
MPSGRSCGFAGRYGSAAAVLGAVAERARLPAMSRLFYVPSAMLNAFAAGRHGDGDHAISGPASAATPLHASSTASPPA